jgi:hypothetical protein
MRTPRLIPELAGSLIHSGLFSVADRLSIDSVTVARGAAWLGFAERMAAEKFDDLWAPVLFIGGRERQASELWQKSRPAALLIATPAERGWNVWLRKPDPADIYRFALAKGNLAMGMPMLAYDAQVMDNGDVWVNAMMEAERDNIWRMHNYGPLMMFESFSGGRVTDGAWTALQRGAWVHLLDQFKATTNDFAGYKNDLVSPRKFFSGKVNWEGAADPSLVGLKETGPLINLGKSEGVGALIPTAALTTRDLLNYGWEMTGLQLGTRHRFVDKSWGVHDLAATIRSGSVANVEGMQPFFDNERMSHSANYRAMLARLQLVNRLQLRNGWTDNPFATSAAKNAQIFVNRAWLRPTEVDWQARSLWEANDFAAISDLFEYHYANGGMLSAAFSLHYLASVRQEELKQFPQTKELIGKFAQKLPYINERYVHALYEQLTKGKDTFERAQAFEKMFWQHPESELEDRVFRNYAMAGAFKSAQRFYKQARPYLKDRSPILLSHGLGSNAYMLGYLLNDAEMRKAGLQDSESGSYADMLLHIFEGVVTSNLKTLHLDVDELVERYSKGDPDDQGVRLQKFLPLLPALRDVKHPKHGEALRYFAGMEEWTIFRWMCIEQFKLPKEDAIRLLGGNDGTVLQRALVAYLEKDKATMLTHVNEFFRRGEIDEYSILLQTLFDRLAAHTFTREEPDLKPQNVVSLSDVVKDAIASRK